MSKFLQTPFRNDRCRSKSKQISKTNSSAMHSGDKIRTKQQQQQKELNKKMRSMEFWFSFLISNNYMKFVLIYFL